MFERVKKFFSMMGNSSPTVSYDDRITALKKVSSNLIKYLIDLSSFQDMKEEEVYEQLFVWEPEIGGAVDRLGTLVGQSYQGVYLKNTDRVEDPKEKKVLELAKEIAETMDIRSQMEALSRLLVIFGNVIVHWPSKDQYQILPNKYMTIIPSRDLIGNPTTDLLTTGEFYVFREGSPDQKIYPKSSITHLKYDDTPIFVKDYQNRWTYGLYSPSPVHRTVIPVWWKRQTMITDIMWRMRNVPREHHRIKSEMFSLDKYDGTLAQRRASAKAEATSTISEYISSLESQMPDQGYVSLDSIEIVPIDSKSAGYMKTNELVEQLDSKIWTALNVPASIVNGTTAGSYASELAVSNYVAAKVIQLATKVKSIVLQCIKAKIRLIDATLPVDNLDIKLELIMTTSRLEIVREASIMATLGIFTDTEIRDHLGWEALTDEQREHLVQIGRARTPGDTQRDVDRSTGTNYPFTPHSDAQSKKDASQLSERRLQP